VVQKSSWKTKVKSSSQYFWQVYPGWIRLFASRARNL